MSRHFAARRRRPGWVTAALAATGATVTLAPSAQGQFLGPFNGGAEIDPHGWFFGEAPPDSHAVINNTDAHSGANSFQLDSSAPNFAPADWRSGDGSGDPGDQQKFSLGAAANGARPLDFSFWYKLPQGAGAGEDIRVDFRFWGADNEANFIGESLAFIGSSSGDTEPMTQWKEFRLEDFTVPAGANFADIRFSVNLFSLFSRTGLFDDFVAEIPITPSNWNVDSNGNWSVAGNWDGGGVPNAPDAIAIFGPVITQPRTVTVNLPHTVGQLRFDNANAYTIAGSNPLTVDVTAGQASISVASGSHTISAPLVLMDNTTITVTPAASTLAITGPLTATGVNLTKAGAGRVDLPSFTANALSIDAGTARVAPGVVPGASRVTNLTIAGGATPSAKLDITNNAFVVDYSGDSPLNTIKAQITSAYNNGSWNGNGITSGNANNTNFGIGYAEASSLTTVPAIFGTVDADAVLFRLTRYGDVNLDGTVNLNDFNALASNFGSTNAMWHQGDFNYDNIVNLNDFNRLAANFGLQAGPGGPTPEDWAALASAVPEPASLGVLFGGASFAFLTRPRRRRSSR